MKLSVVIPAWNEEQLLPACLDSVRMAFAARPDMRPEVIVVDNNSTDATAQVATDHGARVVFEPVNQISRARNAGAAEANTPYLLFVDADTKVSARLLGAALECLGSRNTCGGGSTLVFDDAPPRADFMVRCWTCLLYTSPSPRDATLSRMPSSA